MAKNLSEMEKGLWFKQSSLIACISDYQEVLLPH